jgi:hypothetical protein
MYQLGSPWADFPDIWFWRLVWRSVEKFQSWLKSDKVSDTLQRLKYIHTVESRTKYFVDQQQCTWNQLLCFHGKTQQFFIFDSDMWINNKREGIVAFSLQHFQYLYIFKSYIYITIYCNWPTFMKCKHTKRLLTAVRRHLSKLRSKPRNA